MLNAFQALQTATGALPLQLGSALANAEDAAFGELALTHFETLSWYLAPYAYFLAACAHPYNAIVCILSAGVDVITRAWSPPLCFAAGVYGLLLGAEMQHAALIMSVA